MNQIAPYGDVHQSHMSHHGPSSGPPSGLGHYAAYQPPLLQPGPQSYASAPTPTYGHYSYSQPGHPVTSAMSNNLIPQPLPQLPVMSSAPGAQSLTGSQHQSGHTFDTSGQIAPPGMKPRVTATLWEDEGSLCFQVEAKGVCVARRDDNHMINGTKLLNVAGMTRGRRDGILKSEKTRHVVKIGPMHLKGVWIPFERALDFANKEKITEQLYPLFVHEIGALLVHPSNQQRPGIGNSHALAAVDRRRSDARYMTGPPATQAPPLHHHHSMSTPMPAQSPHSIAPHPSAGRPVLDRAHTFPTPPTSASSNFGVGPHANSYDWQGSQALSIDTGLTRTVPATPTSTSPGNAIPGMQYHSSPAYDGSRQVYTAPAPQAQYPSQLRQFGGPLHGSAYPKSDMAPPPRAGETEQAGDSKPAHDVAQPAEDAEHEHESEYTHTSAPYNPTRASYSYQPNPSVLPRVSDEVATSPHRNGSGRATPRSTDPQWQAGYGAPQGQPAASNVYNVMEPRGANGDAYSYPGTYVNGNTASNKRGREDDEEVDEALKRQKTGESQNGGPVGGSPSTTANRPRATASSRRAR